MHFDKENMKIIIHPEDAIYNLTITFLVEQEGYKMPSGTVPFSFSCKISPENPKDDLLVNLIKYLCNNKENKTLVIRICIGKLLIFLTQRNSNDETAEIKSMRQKLDDMQSRTLPDNFEFSDLEYKKKDPIKTLRVIFEDLMRITTGASESPRRRAGSFTRSLSARGSQFTSAVTEAVRTASPLKKRKDKGSRSGSGTATPQIPERTPSADLTKLRDDERTPLLPTPPAAKPAAAASSSSAPGNVAPNAGLLFGQRSLANADDKVELYQPGQIKSSQILFTTFYEERRDLLTICCGDKEILDLIEGILKRYVTVTPFNQHNIQFKYNDLANQKLNLNRIFPIDLRGLPEAITQSVQNKRQPTIHIKKPANASINDDASDEEDKSKCCKWLRSCC